MVLGVRCSLSKLEDLSSNPQYHEKARSEDSL